MPSLKKALKKDRNAGNTIADALSKLAAQGRELPWMSIPDVLHVLPDMPWLSEVLQLSGIDVQE